MGVPALFFFFSFGKSNMTLSDDLFILASSLLDSVRDHQEVAATHKTELLTLLELLFALQYRLDTGPVGGGARSVEECLKLLKPGWLAAFKVEDD